jgi:hypothetical protein
MGIAQRRQQLYPVAGMGLDGEGEQAIGGEDARNAGDDRRQIIDIDKDVGGEDEVIDSFIAGFVGQKIRKLCSYEKDRRRPANRRTAGTRRRQGPCRSRGRAWSRSAAPHRRRE